MVFLCLYEIPKEHANITEFIIADLVENYNI